MRLITAGLGLWLLAAHFLRGGHLLVAAALAASPTALFIRSPVSRRVVQAALAAGALVWLSTAVRLAHERREDGRPWVRMAVILGSVASVTALGAGLLEGRRAEAWFASSPRAD